jgi:hypothetical protein
MFETYPLVYCIWLLFFIVIGTSLSYWKKFEVYFMVYGMMHAWGTLWYMVWTLDVDMVYMRIYISDRESDRWMVQYQWK